MIKNYLVTDLLLLEKFFNRKNLVPSPSVDADLFFERNELKTLISKILFKIFNLKAKTQILFYGDKGSGKSHLLAYFKSKLFHTYNMLPFEVDFIFARTPFQLYLQIFYSLKRMGCLDAFLDFIRKPTGLRELKRITHPYNYVSTAYIKLNRNIDQLKHWMLGELCNSKLNLPDIENVEVEIDVLTSILRFYYSFFTEQLYPILIGDHCETLVDDLITYIGSKEKVDMIRIISRVTDISSCLLTVNSDKIDEFKRFFYPRISNFEIYEIPPLDRDNVNLFLSDLRKAFIKIQEKTEFCHVYENEKTDHESYPLTMEAKQYLETVSPLQPYHLTNILQKALEHAVTVRGTYLITRKDVEHAVFDVSPNLLYRCPVCGKRLKIILVEVRPRGYGKQKIEKVRCPNCKQNANSIIPIVLDNVVIDSSSLADFDFSTIFWQTPGLQVRKPKVLIPSAVMSELSYWEKKQEKRRTYVKARQEFQRLTNLDISGKIRLILDIGRKPTLSEIKQAREINSVDRIIIDVAKVYDATILTRDKGMVMNSLNKVRFTVLVYETSKF